jgi:hypothetical protein
MAVSQLGKENHALVEQLFETFGLFEADHVMGEAYEKAHAGEISDQAAYVAEVLEKARTKRD